MHEKEYGAYSEYWNPGEYIDSDDDDEEAEETTSVYDGGWNDGFFVGRSEGWEEGYKDGLDDGRREISELETGTPETTGGSSPFIVGGIFGLMVGLLTNFVVVPIAKKVNKNVIQPAIARLKQKKTHTQTESPIEDTSSEVRQS